MLFLFTFQLYNFFLSALAILVSVGCGKALEGTEKGAPVNSYIVVRMIDSVDRLTSGRGPKYTK